MRVINSNIVSLLKNFFGRLPSEPIVIVSGLPRSGTSMLMGMLEAGGLELISDRARTPDEDNPKGYYELERVKDLDKTEDTSWLAGAGGKGLKVISFLLQFLPESHHYKIIFVRRSLPEVLASQQKMLERQGTEEETVDDKEMTKLFTDHLKKVEAHLNAQQNCDVLYIQHRETLNMPKKVAQQVNNFLGGRLDIEAMAEVVDQGLYRNRT